MRALHDLLWLRYGCHVPDTAPTFWSLPVPSQNGGSQNGYPPFLTRNTLNRNEYIPSMTPPQIKTAIDCARASDIRGTLRARLIVAKERMPSGEELAESWIGCLKSTLTYTSRLRFGSRD